MRDLPPRPEVLEMLTMIVEARNERDWRHLAACKGMDPNIFFPTHAHRYSCNTAKAVCAACPVKTQCYQEGSTEHTGVWGGTSVNERRKQGCPRNSFNQKYRQWIMDTEPSDEIAAHDLGIQIKSVQRSRLRAQQAKEGTR
jgi:WhiB family redox-sensing transcriptional regulator